MTAYLERLWRQYWVAVSRGDRVAMYALRAQIRRASGGDFTPAGAMAVAA